MKAKWTGGTSDAFYNYEKIDELRVIHNPEWGYTLPVNKKITNFFYVIGVDVGRYNCTTEAVVFKVYPTEFGSFSKVVVNIYTFENEHFEDQSIALKKLYYKFKARAIAIDGNGVGAGLLDFLVTSQTDQNTGEELIPFQVINDEDGKYAQQRGSCCEPESIYVFKANNNNLNTAMYSYVKMQLNAKKVKFLIDEGEARNALLRSREGAEMTPESRALKLRPFLYTSNLKEQMLNLVEKSDGNNIILHRVSSKIPKDKFSAFSYGMMYIKLQEDSNNRLSRNSLSDFMFFD